MDNKIPNGTAQELYATPELQDSVSRKSANVSGWTKRNTFGRVWNTRLNNHYKIGKLIINNKKLILLPPSYTPKYFHRMYMIHVLSVTKYDVIGI